MSERVARIFSDDIEIGSIPYSEYEAISTFANSKKNRFLSFISFCSSEIRMAIGIFFKIFKINLVVLIVLFLLFSHLNISDLIDHLRTASSELIAQQLHIITEFLFVLSFIISSAYFFLSANKQNSYRVDYVNRSIRRGISRILETPCYGVMTIRLEGNNEKL